MPKCQVPVKSLLKPRPQVDHLLIDTDINVDSELGMLMRRHLPNSKLFQIYEFLRLTSFLSHKDGYHYLRIFGPTFYLPYLNEVTDRVCDFIASTPPPFYL